MTYITMYFSYIYDDGDGSCGYMDASIVTNTVTTMTCTVYEGLDTEGGMFGCSYIPMVGTGDVVAGPSLVPLDDLAGYSYGVEGEIPDDSIMNTSTPNRTIITTVEGTVLLDDDREVGYKWDYVRYTEAGTEREGPWEDRGLVFVPASGGFDGYGFYRLMDPTDCGFADSTSTSVVVSEVNLNIYATNSYTTTYREPCHLANRMPVGAQVLAQPMSFTYTHPFSGDAADLRVKVFIPTSLETTYPKASHLWELETKATWLRPGGDKYEVMYAAYAP